MHPEVVSDHPGRLSEVRHGAGTADDHARRRPEPRTGRHDDGGSGSASLLGLPVFRHRDGRHASRQSAASLTPGALNWVQLVLATPVVFWCGWPFFERAWLSVRNVSPNMFTLIALGVGAAYLYSLVATVAPGAFPEGFREHGGAVMPYFDTAVVVTVLVLLGQVLELKARGQTSAAIKALLGLAPKTARRVRDGGVEEDVPLEQVRAGRSAARAARRESAGRRRRRRRTQRGRRVDDLRASRCRSKRSRAAKVVAGHDQRHRCACWSGPSESAPTRCWRKSSAWSARPSAAGRRSSASSIGWRGFSCRRRRWSVS